MCTCVCVWVGSCAWAYAGVSVCVCALRMQWIMLIVHAAYSDCHPHCTSSGARSDGFNAKAPESGTQINYAGSNRMHTHTRTQKLI